ncbi:MAG TPA: arylsulfotransferase family protein [Burkholderiales bacterium]|nr:arylsulfotransferase family protein [Burkholderiales bacterium]
MSVDQQNTGESRRGFWISVVAAVSLVLLAVVLLTAALVREAMKEDGSRLSKTQTRMVMLVARFPALVKGVVSEVTGTAPNPFLKRKTGAEKPHWVRKFPAPEDDGYLLLSAVDPQVKHFTVQLIRIADGDVLAKWTPDWNAIYSKLSAKKWEPKGQSSRAVPYHPLLLDNGDIIFNTGKGMVRSSLCTTEPVWVLDQVVHHSNELALDGRSVWAPSVAEGYFSENKLLSDKMRDDSIARISFDGEVLENHSLSKILIDNGLRELLLGTSGHVLRDDPLHLNQISVAPSDGKYWKRGDLLLSMRSLSTVALYRPSTGKIIWHQLGPWMSQHAAVFVDDHRISIFDNNSYSGAPKSRPFVKPDETNRIFIYDFETKQVTQPYAQLLAQQKPVTWNQGLARVLPDGGLFVEETNYGRHLRFTKDKLLWSRINDYDKDHIGIVAWSRYLTPSEAKQPLAGIADRQCK